MLCVGVKGCTAGPLEYMNISLYTDIGQPTLPFGKSEMNGENSGEGIKLGAGFSLTPTVGERKQNVY